MGAVGRRAGAMGSPSFAGSNSLTKEIPSPPPPSRSETLRLLISREVGGGRTVSHIDGPALRSTHALWVPARFQTTDETSDKLQGQLAGEKTREEECANASDGNKIKQKVSVCLL